MSSRPQRPHLTLYALPSINCEFFLFVSTDNSEWVEIERRLCRFKSVKQCSCRYYSAIIENSFIGNMILIHDCLRSVFNHVYLLRGSVNNGFIVLIKNKSNLNILNTFGDFNFLECCVIRLCEICYSCCCLATPILVFINLYYRGRAWARRFVSRSFR